MITLRWLRVEIATLAVLAVPFSAAWGEAPELKRAIVALKSGNAQQALTLFTTELGAPDRSPEDRARTFYFRAKTYLALKQPALAIADAGAALWLNKLSPSEAADAAQLKAQAQRSVEAGAGLPAFAPAINSQPRPEAIPAKATSAVEPSRGAPTQPIRQMPSAAQQAAVSAPPTTRQAASTWSSASVKREELPQPAPAAPVTTQPVTPAVAWITSPPRPAVEPQATADIVTGSITRTDPSTTPQARQLPVPALQEQSVAAAPPPQASSPLVAETSTPQTEASQNTPAASVIPSLPSLGGWFEPDPMRADVEQANELQRRHHEKLRSHNQEAQARVAAQNSDAQPTNSESPASP